MAEAAVAPALLTAEEFLALPEPGDGTHFELVEGRVIAMPPVGPDHGRQSASFTIALGSHVKAHRLGHVLVGDVAVRVQRHPDTILAPDVAFWTFERLPTIQGSYVDVAPDLAIEVVSPSDRRRAVYAEAETWLAAGARVVWIVWPDERTVEACLPNGDSTLHGVESVLTCPELLPGFELPVADLFDDLGERHG